MTKQNWKERTKRIPENKYIDWKIKLIKVQPNIHKLNKKKIQQFWKNEGAKMSKDTNSKKVYTAWCLTDAKQ